MHEIGGFFELELAQRQSLHPQALALNSGRNALRLLLGANRIRSLRIPAYSCPTLVPAIRAAGVNVTFYPVTPDLEPAAFVAPAADEAVLLVNYFGLKDAAVQHYAANYRNIVVDQCQALFATPPAAGLGSFYSPRKFVGVADGGYLYSAQPLSLSLPVDESGGRYLPRLQRLDTGAPAAFADYQRAEVQVGDLPPAMMSRLTRTILASVDYEVVARRRRENFAMLHALLSGVNALSLQLDEQAVPMVYPLVIDSPGLREHLVRQGVYVARYWPDPAGVLHCDPVTEKLSDRLLALPIDQRYGAVDMQLIADLVSAYVSSPGLQAQGR